MMKLVTGMFSGLVLSQTVLADPPAVYQDGVLTIHGGAVINAEGFNTYYRNIQLQADETGAFRIVGVEAAELADVETVNVLVTENEMSEVEVVVSGTKSACCSRPRKITSCVECSFSNFFKIQKAIV